MSGANVDKAQQVRPPIAVYAYALTTDVVISLPGAPANIGGAAPEGRHGLLLNFITLQNAEPPGGDPIHYYLNGDPTTGFAAAANTDVYPAVPSPLTGQYAVLQAGETVRFDLSNLYDHTQPGLAPLQYLHADTPGTATLRFWRSSGR